MTDIYGANLYNRYLEERVRTRQTAAQVVQATVEGTGGGGSPKALLQDQDMETALESELASPSATSCKSLLVCTGIYNPHSEVPADASHSITETVFHGHRDFRFDPALMEPGHIVEDVHNAVELICQQENFVSTRH